MHYGVPLLEFANSEGGMPLPEFYEDYPFYCEGDIPPNDYHYIYKKYDGAASMQLIPTTSDTELNSEIIQIHMFSPNHRVDLGTIGSEGFTVDKESKTLTLTEQGQAQAMTAKFSYAYVVFEVCVEKYRLIPDDPTEQEEEIIAMQKIHKNLMQYLYQFQIAQDTESTLQEIAYTNKVTFISTLITIVPMVLGGAVSKIFKASGEASGLATAHLGTIEFGKKVFQGGQQIFRAVSEQLTKELNKQIVSIAALAVLGAISGVVGEMCEEVFLDPFVGSVGARVFSGFGAWENKYAELIGSSLFESGREAGGSAASAIRSSLSTKRLQSQLSDPSLSAQKELEIAKSSYQKQLDAQNGKKMPKDFVKFGIKSMLAGIALGPAGVGLVLASNLESLALNIHSQLSQIRLKRFLTQLRLDASLHITGQYDARGKRVQQICGMRVADSGDLELNYEHKPAIERWSSSREVLEIYKKEFPWAARKMEKQFTEHGRFFVHAQAGERITVKDIETVYRSGVAQAREEFILALLKTIYKHREIIYNSYGIKIREAKALTLSGELVNELVGPRKFEELSSNILAGGKIPNTAVYLKRVGMYESIESILKFKPLLKALESLSSESKSDFNLVSQEYNNYLDVRGFRTRASVALVEAFKSNGIDAKEGLIAKELGIGSKFYTKVKYRDPSSKWSRDSSSQDFFFTGVSRLDTLFKPLLKIYLVDDIHLERLGGVEINTLRDDCYDSVMRAYFKEYGTSSSISKKFIKASFLSLVSYNKDFFKNKDISKMRLGEFKILKDLSLFCGLDRQYFTDSFERIQSFPSFYRSNY